MNCTDKPDELHQTLDERAVLHYLLQHPDFFIRNAQHVESLRVPHPVRGSVSLIEWHLARLRHHVTQLEEEITQLMEQACANEKLFNHLLALPNDLIAAQSLQQMLAQLQNWARGLGLVSADIRLFTDSWLIEPPSDFISLRLARSAFEPLRIQRLADRRHYLGSLNGQELQLLLPELKQVGSVALSMLDNQHFSGVIVFSSRDSWHYSNEMGTIILEKLADMLPILLERWIKRR